MHEPNLKAQLTFNCPGCGREHSADLTWAIPSTLSPAVPTHHRWRCDCDSRLDLAFSVGDVSATVDVPGAVHPNTHHYFWNGVEWEFAEDDHWEE